MSFFRLFRYRFARRCCVAAIVAALAAASAPPVGATIIPGLYNTGVDNSGNNLAPGLVDPHYALVSSDDLIYPVPTAYVVSTALPAAWLANAAKGQWISPNVNQTSPPDVPGAPVGNAAGTYIFELTFNLTGFDPSKVTIEGDWAADDLGMIFLNSVFVPGTMNSNGPGALKHFTVSSNFTSGVNYLDFIVINGGGGSPLGSPTGVQVLNLTAVVVPEPATVLLASLGLLSLPVARRFRRRAM